MPGPRESQRAGGAWCFGFDRVDRLAPLPRHFRKAEIKQHGYSSNTHLAVFVEVKVDDDLGTLHVTSAVSAIAARQNSQSEDPLAAKFSAVSFGGWEWLQEESVIDQSYGRIMNHNLAE